MRAKGLILTYGNPSRGDDALGPAMFEMLEAYKLDTTDLEHIDLLTDFQLQIEHAIDLIDRRYIIFVDASISCLEPFECQPLLAEKDDSFTTHAMSPSSVLAVYKQIRQCDPPPAWLLTIRAYEFGLGKSMSEQAKANLQKAFRYIVEMDPETLVQNT
jgi:hydrogenase maturation protease